MSTSGGIRAGGLSVATLHVTAAQLSTLFSAPVTLVAAPGANTAIAVLGIEYETVAGNSVWAMNNAGLYYAGNVAASMAINDGLGNMNLFGSTSLTSEVQRAAFASPLTTDTAKVADKAVIVAERTANDVRSSTIVTTTLANGGAGYVIGDTGTIDTPTVGPVAAYVVDTVGALGIVLTYHVVAGAGLYDTANNPHTTTAAGAQPGVGTGLTLNITAIAVATGDLYVTAFYQTFTTH